jgi:membrane fusion protein (multidrug efflux system)
MAQERQNEASSSSPESAQSRRDRSAVRTGRSKIVVVFLVAIVLLIMGGRWVYHRYTHVYTEDARIDGDVVTISSRVSGWLTELNVIEGDSVTKGQVLAKVDARDSLLQREVLLSKLKSIESQAAVIRAQSGQVDEETLGKLQSDTSQLVAAEAQVAALQAQLKQARDDYERARELTEQKWLSQQAMERARTTYQQAQENHRKAVAEVAAARGMLSASGGSRKQLNVLESQLIVLQRQADEIRAEMRRQEIDISDRTIVAPSDGRVVMTFVSQDEHVAVGQRILMFHNPTSIWVEANVKETEVGLLEPGMKAQIRVDAYPDQSFSGEVFRIGRAATSKFALLPDPNPSGNFTKITQRLPVRIRLDEADVKLRPGMMVEVDIAIRDR